MTSRKLTLAIVMGNVIALLLGQCPKGLAGDNGPGVKVGAKAPDFTMTDQHGKKRALQELLKKGNVAIVFHRSVRW